MTIAVIYNPRAGKDRAWERLQQLRARWPRQLEFWPTQAPGHGEELAQRAAESGCAVVVAAGGDGTVHEVANGLLRAARPEVRLVVVPIGSANDYAYSLGVGWSDTVREQHVDVCRVTAPNGRMRYGVCCLGLGLNGAVTLESRRLRRLQGVALYGCAALRALWYHYTLPQMTLQFDEQPEQTQRTLLLSLLVGRREGGFVMAPQASLSDGLLNYLHAGELARWELLCLLPRLALWGAPAKYPKVTQGQCRRLRLRSEQPLLVHIDGEFFCQPADGVRELTIEVCPQALWVRKELQL